LYGKVVDVKNIYFRIDILIIIYTQQNNYLAFLSFNQVKIMLMQRRGKTLKKRRIGHSSSMPPCSGDFNM
jgi:hypothetical protein